MTSPHLPTTIRCRAVLVPREACYVRFKDGKIDRSDDIGTTARGESLIADYDSEGQILGIELIGAHKPCQQ